MDYFKAMKPLADKGIPQIYSTLEHGWQGNYFHIYDDLEKFNKANADANEDYKPIKFVFGVEAYWVHNHKDKDATNNHIVLLAKNENGRKALNRAIAKSYISKESLEKGIAQEMFPEVNNDDVYYYYKNRMDIDLLLSLPKDDIFVTTACIAFWLKYSNDGSYWDIIDNDVLRLSSHFTDFYLEIQANNTESQKMVNEHIMELHNKYNIPIIAGCDSHYISNNQKDDVDLYIFVDYSIKDNVIKFNSIKLSWKGDTLSEIKTKNIPAKVIKNGKDVITLSLSEKE
jgi:DNA polymerase III alpha subunit